MQFKFYWPLWLLLILLLISGGLAVSTYLGLKQPRITKLTKFGLIGLRLLSIFVLLFCLVQPIRIEQKDITPVPNLLLLVDTTSSMGLPDAKIKGVEKLVSRLEAVKKWFSENDLVRVFSNGTNLSDKIEPHFYQFSKDQLSTIDIGTNANMLTPLGQKTDFQAAINQTILQWRGQPIAGIVLISDGGHNVGSIDLDQIQQLNIPIYTLGVGNAIPPSDVAVDKIEVSPIVYVNQKTNLRAIIHQRGFDRQKAEIRLKNSSATIASERITFTENIVESKLVSRQIIDFEIKPKTEGTLTYTVQLPRLAGEVTTENNQKTITIRAVKSKLTVLLVDGHPRWDYAFLKRDLTQNADIEVEGMVLQTPPPFPINSDMKPAQTFPTQAINLLRYDVIVLGDLSSNQLSVDQQQALIDYVQQFGRSIVFLSGKTALGVNGLVNSRLSQLLPIIAPNGCLLKPTEVDLVLTNDGQYHPVMQLGLSVNLNQKIWQNLPALSGSFEQFKLKSNAVSLAEHKSSSTPILIYQQSGLGRCLMLAAAGSWQWSFQANQIANEQLSNSHYTRFWSQAIRWLAVRATNNSIHLTTDRVNYQVGQTVELTIYAYDDNSMPRTQAEIRLDVAPNDAPSFQLSATEIGEGIYRTTFPTTIAGRYVVQANISNDRDQIEVQVQANTSEFDKPYLDQDLMTILANNTGGIYRPLETISAKELIDLIPTRQQSVYQPIEHQLWNHPLILLFAVILLGSEWFWRKRCGLV